MIYVIEILLITIIYSVRLILLINW